MDSTQTLSSIFRSWCLLLGIFIQLASGQLSDSQGYQPRYNPQYTNLQQNPSTTVQYDNPSLKSSSDISGNDLALNKIIPSSPTAYNSYFESNTLGSGGSSSYNSDIFGRNYGGLNNYNSKDSGPFSDMYEDEDNFCPEHWISFRQSCYRFVRSPKRSWLNAKKICAAYQANLVNVDSIEKHSFIMQQLIMKNQKLSRYWISARQTGPNNWINDDNTQLLILEDAFARDEDDLAMENEDLHDNRYLVQRPYSPPNNYFGSGSLSKNQNQNNFRGFYGTGSQYGGDGIHRDRLVYGYSKKHDRWMFIPANDDDLNLFICESNLLHNVDNIQTKIDENRPYHYGLNIRDSEKVPRGPYFIKQPQDNVYDISKNRMINDVTLSCLAGGYPTPIYYWYREIYVNDTLEYKRVDPFSNDRYTVSGGNLIIYEPNQALDQGAYHCVAENDFGRIRSESAHLNFGFIMEFNLKRSSETADMNSGKSIFCDPPGHYPDIKYYWSRNFFPNFVEEDQRVFVSHDGALYFSYIELVDSANYSCTVQTLVSDTGRNGPFFHLRVDANSNYQALIFANSFPKVFPEAPIAGDEIRLECMAFGYPIPSYNWTRKGMPLQHNAYTMNYNRVLIIQNATTNDNGEYTCTISNAHKSNEKSVFINIQMKPEFSIPLKDKVKDYNSDITFICEAYAIPDANYTWYKNAKLLDPEKIDKDRYIIQDNLLTIKYLDADRDDGMYQCGATNQLKTSFSSAQLRVLSMKPSFKKHPLEAEIYAMHNGNTSIICNPEAAPRPKFQWKKNGQLIGSGGHRRILPSGTLIISPTSREDEGAYTCVATNLGGTDESTAHLIVLQELRFIQTPPPRIITQVNDAIYLQCEATYDEILDVAYIWKHNGAVLNNNQDGTERITIDYNRLVVHNVTMLDSGEYECLVKSAVNEITSRTVVTVEGPPGAPGGIQVIDVGKTKATIEWVDGASNGRPIRYYNILGRTNWNRTWVNVSMHVMAHEVDRYSGKKQAEVQNLTPWSSYEFSVAAVNDLGIGTPSDPSPIYSTHEDRPYIAPRNVGGGGGKIGDLTITWDPLQSDEQNSHGIYYKIFWRLKDKYEWASEIIKRADNIGMAVVNIPLNNYYTEYEVKVQAMNNVGKGPESEPVVIYSAEDMPQVAPQKVIPHAFNSTAFNVTWDPIDITRENIRGRLIGHRIKYWKTTHQEEDAVYFLSRTTRNWALIVGLQPDTYYFVKVMAYNAAGEGPESERSEERTYRKAPQKPPTSVHVYGINPSTVRVVWRYISPAQDEEPIMGYKVRVWENDQNMVTANDTLIEIGQKLEAYITTLTPGKSYNMRVLAFSNGGDGRMSSPTLRFQMGTITRNVGHRENISTNLMVLTAFIMIISANICNLSK